jgi:hypothetical protein
MCDREYRCVGIEARSAGGSLGGGGPEGERVANGAVCNILCSDAGTEESIGKETFRDTIGLHGTGWRVLGIGERE